MTGRPWENSNCPRCVRPFSAIYRSVQSLVPTTVGKIESRQGRLQPLVQSLVRPLVLSLVQSLVRRPWENLSLGKAASNLLSIQYLQAHSRSVLASRRTKVSHGLNVQLMPPWELTNLVRACSEPGRRTSRCGVKLGLIKVAPSLFKHGRLAEFYQPTERWIYSRLTRDDPRSS